MKTAKWILGLGMITLASVTSGQFEELAGRILPRHSEVNTYFTADYNHIDNSRIEDWMNDLHSWASDRFARKMEEPEVYMRIFSRNIEVAYEEESTLENWMASPFETGISENELIIESWMESPFESGTIENELSIESWMVSPFESGTIENELFIESWMVSPFESGTIENELFIESWMKAPFGTAREESLEVESWMKAPFGPVREESPEVESWMTSPFNACESYLCENDNKLESWMLLPFETNDRLMVEDWMISSWRI
jgi:hypothetical protein